MKNAGQIYKIIFSALVMTLVLSFGVPKNNAWGSQSATKKVTLNVSGMYCSMCPIKIRVAVEKIPGVVKATASLKKATATVWYKKDKVTVQQIIKTIDGIGYKASLIAPNKAAQKKEKNR